MNYRVGQSDFVQYDRLQKGRHD